MKQRLDITIFEKGLTESREKARALIMSGNVYVDGEQVTKSGFQTSPENVIELKNMPSRYVSRGGFKLEKALSEFKIDIQGMICGDFGASTGGFTDCMLQNGAAKVYAVDVGYGQLAWKLRTDERVVCMERTNVRYLTPESIDDKLDFFSVDVSFISLRTVLPAIFTLMADNAAGVCLIKPQFEAGREKVGKHGVVREIETHIDVINKIIGFVESSGKYVSGLSFSPIKGPEGNIEFLIYITNTPTGYVFDSHAVADDAQKTLKECR